MSEGPDERSEQERFYDEVLAPKLEEVSNLCHEHGASMICTVEYEPGGMGTTMRGIGPESGIVMKLLQLLTFSKGNIDGFFMQCMKRFDMSQTMIGSFIRKMEAEQELQRIRKEVSNAARDEDEDEEDGLGEPPAEPSRDERSTPSASERVAGAMGRRRRGAQGGRQ